MSAPILYDQHGRELAYSQVYEGANYSRNRTYIPPYVADSNKTATRFTRRQMLAYARYLYANVGFIKGAIDAIANYSVGTGIGLKSRIADKGIRARYNEGWENWKEVCQFNGNLHFDKLCNLSSRATDTDGDLGCILTQNEEGQARIQMVSGHRIDDCDEGDSEDGVILDDHDTPLRYRIRNESAERGFIEIPADRFILLYDPERHDERRGKSGLHHGITTAWNNKDTLGYEATAVKLHSAIAATLKRQGDRRPFMGRRATQNTDANSPETIEQLFGGAIVPLQMGEEFQVHSSNRPSPAFTGFLDYNDEDIALGLNVPVPFLRLRTLKGTDRRAVFVQAEKKFEDRQEMIVRFMKRVRFFWASLETIRFKRSGGKVGLPITPDFYKCVPEYPASPTVDYGREAQQNREDLKYGNRTLQKDVGEQGDDWEEHREQISTEKKDVITRALELMDFTEKVSKGKVQLSFEKACSMIEDTTNGNTPSAPQPAEKPTAGKKPVKDVEEEEETEGAEEEEK